MITLWYALVVLCWVLFFVLDGFDFGVGLLAPLIGRDERERGAAVSTIGPFWDGNEVWLVAAVGATFAAFPGWYAALLSALYLPLAAILLLLAVRGVALEFRGKHDGTRWRRGWEVALAASSAGIVALWGAVLATMARGLALRADGSVAGSGLARSVAPMLTAESAVGAMVAVCAAALLGATFLSLRTSGPVRDRARRVALSASFAAAVLSGVIGGLGWVAVVLCVVVGVLAWARREALAFGTAAAGVAAAVVAVFTAHGDVVLRSTLHPAWSLTMTNAAAGDSALRLITTVGVVVLPGVLAYQAFSYWVFRRRVASGRTPS